MTQFNADILLATKLDDAGTRRLFKDLKSIENLVDKINATPLDPVSFKGSKTGIGSGVLLEAKNTLRDITNAFQKAESPIALATARAEFFGKSINSAALKAQLFNDVLTNIDTTQASLRSGEVDNLANAWAQATTAVEVYSNRVDALKDTALQQARQQAGLPLGPVSTLGTVEADAAAASAKAQTTYQAQINKNLRTDITYQRLKLDLLLDQSQALLQQDSLAARLANKAAQLGGAGKLGESLSLGVGFPLLFGAGPGSIFGSGVGSFFGKGFGGQILGGGIGQILDDAVIRAQELGNSIRDLDVGQFETQLGVVSNELRNQVELYKEIGDYEAARNALSVAAATQTGAVSGAVEDIANATNVLSDSWSKFVSIGSTFIGLVAAPLTVALAAVLETFNFILKVVNNLFSVLGLALKNIVSFAINAVAGKDAVKGIEDNLRGVNSELDESIQKSNQLRTSLLEALSTELEQLEFDKRIDPGTGIDAKLSNIQLEYDRKRADILKERKNTQKEINKLQGKGAEIAKQERTEEANALANSKIERALIERDNAMTAVFNRAAEKAASEAERAAKARAAENKKAAEAAEREALALAKLSTNLATSTKLLDIDKQIAEATVDGNKQKLAELEVDRLMEESAGRKAAILVENVSNAQKNNLLLIEDNKLETELLRLDTARALERKKLEDSFKATVAGLEFELAYAKAITREEQNALELAQTRAKLKGEGRTDKEIDDILKLTKSLQAAQAPLQAYITDTQRWLADTDSMIVSLSQSISSGISGAISTAVTGLVDGSATVNEALSDMFKSIGDAFISMAAEIIAQQLVMITLQGILKALGVAVGGGGTDTPDIKGFSAYSISDQPLTLNDFPTYAEGGYVTSPTSATIGEGSSSEYVIPESKMSGAMSRWNSGVRGDALVSGAEPTGGAGGVALAAAPTNIVVEGGVLNFNDSQYIRQDQVPSIVKQASAAGEAMALRKLQMSTATRKRIGL